MPRSARLASDAPHSQGHHSLRERRAVSMVASVLSGGDRAAWDSAMERESRDRAVLHARTLRAGADVVKHARSRGRAPSARRLRVSNDLERVSWSARADEDAAAWRPLAALSRVEAEAGGAALLLRVDGKKRRLAFASEEERDAWAAALEWRRALGKRDDDDGGVSRPFNVRHELSVSSDLRWSSAAASDSSPASPRSLADSFELVRLLGYGTYGRVFEAVHRGTGFRLAVKLVFVDDTLSADEIAREVDILRSCRHENIVTYYGCFGPDDRGQLWILMSLCAAGSVVDLMERRGDEPLDEGELALAARGAVRALAHLHLELHVVHRDVKGRNLLVAPGGGGVLLTDFGGSRQLRGGDPHLKLSRLQGSPYWMAPEVVSEVEYGYPADVWSLGVTLLELAEGLPPHASLTPFAAMRRTLDGPPPGPSDPARWSADLLDLLGRCLVKNPARRAGIAELLDHPFLARTAHSLRTPVSPPAETPRPSGGGSETGEEKAHDEEQEEEKEEEEEEEDDDDDDEEKDSDVVDEDQTESNADAPANEDCWHVAGGGVVHRVSVTEPRVVGHAPARHTDYTVTTVTRRPNRTLRVRTVKRRYNEFAWLRGTLECDVPAAVLPPLPPGKVIGRFRERFVAERRRALEVLARAVVEHPHALARSPAAAAFFFDANRARFAAAVERHKPPAASARRGLARLAGRAGEAVERHLARGAGAAQRSRDDVAAARGERVETAAADRAHAMASALDEVALATEAQAAAWDRAAASLAAAEPGVGEPALGPAAAGAARAAAVGREHAGVVRAGALAPARLAADEAGEAVRMLGRRSMQRLRLGRLMARLASAEADLDRRQARARERPSEEAHAVAAAGRAAELLNAANEGTERLRAQSAEGREELGRVRRRRAAGLRRAAVLLAEHQILVQRQLARQWQAVADAIEDLDDDGADEYSSKIG